MTQDADSSGNEESMYAMYVPKISDFHASDDVCVIMKIPFCKPQLADSIMTPCNKRENYDYRKYEKVQEEEGGYARDDNCTVGKISIGWIKCVWAFI